MPRTKKTDPTALATALHALIRAEIAAATASAKPAKTKARSAKAKTKSAKTKAKPVEAKTKPARASKPMGRKPRPLDPVLVRSFWKKLPTAKADAISRAALGVPIKSEIVDVIISRALDWGLIRKQGAARWTTYWTKTPVEKALAKLCPEAKLSELVEWDQPTAPAPEIIVETTEPVQEEPAMPTPSTPSVDA